jgi:hypothetical protein
VRVTVEADDAALVQSTLDTLAEAVRAAALTPVKPQPPAGGDAASCPPIF